MENQIIDEYKNAIGEMFYTVISERDFEKNENPFYCYNSIANFSNTINDRLTNNNELKELGELYKFNEALTDLLKEMTMFFIAIYKYDGSNESYIGVSYVNVSQSFKNLERFDAFINEHVQLNHFDNVLLIKDYYSNLIGEALLFLDNNLYLDIKKCSFKMDFDEIKLRYENSINYNDVSLRMKIQTTSKKDVKEIPAFFDFIYNVNDKTEFAIDLKKTFRIEKGIEFKIMIELLKEKEIFIIGDRMFKSFYENIKTYFDRDIGSRTSLNDYYKHSEENQKYYKDKIDILKIKLNPILKKHLNS